jgi:hypothetical protein
VVKAGGLEKNANSIWRVQMSQLRLLVHLSALGLVTVAPVATGISGRAEASVVIDISQVGSDVVAEGNGAIDLTGLTFNGTANTFGGGRVAGQFGGVLVGLGGEVDGYTGLSGPASFGQGSLRFASSSSGDTFGVTGTEDVAGPIFAELNLPQGYVSGSSLSGSATFDSESIASLGLTPGTYVYTWGPPANDDSLTVEIETIPESSTWAMMLLGFAGLALAGYRTSRRTAAAIGVALVCGSSVSSATPAVAEVIEFTLGAGPKAELISYSLSTTTPSFTVTAPVSRATDFWFLVATTGRVVPEAVLTATAAPNVITWDFSDVLAASVILSSGLETPTVTARFDYRTVSEHFSTVPEPSTWVMMLFGFAGLYWLAGRREDPRRPAFERSFRETSHLDYRRLPSGSVCA